MAVRSAVEQGDLAEEVARPERGHSPPVDGHGGLAPMDHDELPPHLALASDDPSSRECQLGGQAGEEGQFFPGAAGKSGTVLSSPSTYTLAMTSPIRWWLALASSLAPAPHSDKVLSGTGYSYPPGRSSAARPRTAAGSATVMVRP